MPDDPLLKIENLKTSFFTFRGEVKAVDGVSFEIFPGETLGLVGESGCGKSVTSLSILRLIESPPGKIVDGRILFGDRDLAKATEEKLRRIRGKEISMIFQDPMTSLNPLHPVRKQLTETILTHQHIGKAAAEELAVEMLRRVEIPDPEKRAKAYPHELSGGMIQRVMIAMALACKPALLIADEPTTALDVTVQARILELMNQLKREGGTSIMLVTHDMGVVAESCDRVAVMYAGRIVEYAEAETLFAGPRHPYTLGLMRSIPRIDRETERLQAIPGVVPNATSLPHGCKFRDRCRYADDVCAQKEPALEEIEEGKTGARSEGRGAAHAARCRHSDKLIGVTV